LEEATLAGRRSAVLIGVNQCGFNLRLPNLRYAEDDATALHKILTDRAIGTFDPDDARLITGGQANSKLLKTLMRKLALSSKPSDLLLVYFAGHALIPEWGRPSDAYLVTEDLDAETLREEPDTGLRMAFLKRDIFEVFAGTSFLILDCCRAGAYIDSDLSNLEVVGTYGPHIDRHSALLSCPNGAVARENDELRHGALTYHVLRALDGDAADTDGRVTFANMANYAIEQGIDPTPGQLVQMWGPTTVLTQPAATRHQRRQPLTQPISIVSCENSLDRQAAAISQLLGRLFRSEARIPRQPSTARNFGRADLIRLAVDAESVAVVEVAADRLAVMDQTPTFNTDKYRELLEQSRRYCFPVDTVGLGHVGTDERGHRILLVPVLQKKTFTLVLVVAGLPPSLLEIGEPLVTLLQAVWNVNIVDDPLHAEVRVLTALRATFGRLPRSLYERCFDLYRQLINELVTVFQPVISLDRRSHGVAVHSYEALARRRDGDKRAPINILQVAYVWGERFIVERDVLLLRKAMGTYAEADAGAQREGTKPISFNVAVRSLLSDSYLAVLRETVDEALFDRRFITLEISGSTAVLVGAFRP
jgi:hypothetical protein